MIMKEVIYVLIGLLVASNVWGSVISSSPTTISSVLTLNPSSCQIKSSAKFDTFTCPCTGGSGNYNWKFTQLPQGWTISNNVLTVPSGLIKDNLLYGCKVQVSDKNTKQQVSKSLFFYLNNGKIKSIIDYPFNFKANMLVSSAGNFVAAGSSNTLNAISTILLPPTALVGVKNTNITLVKNLFKSVNGIGGGCGLVTLRPYFLGRGGFYSNDSTNPYLHKLPTDAQVNTILSSGNSVSITTLIVNVVRSQVNCKNVVVFMNNLLQQIRNKIVEFGNQVNTSYELISTISNQIKTIQNQQSSTQQTSSSNQSTSQTSSTTASNSEIQTLQESIANNKNAQSSLQTKLNQLNSNATSYQSQLETLVGQQKQCQQKDLDYTKQIDTYNGQIAALQAQIQNLTSHVNEVNANKTENSANLSNLQNQINSLNSETNNTNSQIDETNSQIQKTKNNIAQAQNKISQIQQNTKPTTLTPQSTSNTTTNYTQISQLKQNLKSAQTVYTKAATAYNDLSFNYNSFTSISNYNLNGCYGTIYNDKTILFSEDPNGRMQFHGKGHLVNYIIKIFGKAAKTLTSTNFIIIDNGLKGNNQISQADKSISVPTGSLASSSSSADKGTSTGTGSSVSKVVVDSNSNQIYTVTQTNILSNQWILAYGNPMNQAFKKHDFVIKIPGASEQNSFKGKIKSIKGYICQAVDDKMVPYTLYLGGGTIISSINKPLPQVGDSIYWEGTVKPGGKSTDYNVNQCICY